MGKSLLTTFAVFISCCALAQTFTGKPKYDIQVKRAGTYVGTISVELFPAIAPNHVQNFDSLVSTQFYDSTAFHRVIPGFMIQGGDPNSRHGPRATWGYGDSTQPTVDAEFSAAQHVRGRLSAARDADTNSANSQFFICVAPAAWLNGQYTVYGEVVAGMNIVDTVVLEPRDSLDNPYLKMEMFITAAGSNDTATQTPTLNSPANYSYTSSTSRVLSWTGHSDDVMYIVEVATDSNFTNLHRIDERAGTTYLCSGLQMQNTYYWRVKATNGGDWSSYSPTWRFSVSPTGIESYDAASDVIASSNPGNGLFAFENLPMNSTIEIFDISGRLISTTTATSSTANIDISAMGTGMYFYAIRKDGEDFQQGKLIVK